MARKRFTAEQVIMASPRDLRTVVRLLADQRQIEFPQRRLEIPTQGLKKKSCSRPLRRPFPRSSFL